jgi:hypothetical protein
LGAALPALMRRFVWRRALSESREGAAAYRLGVGMCHLGDLHEYAYDETRAFPRGNDPSRGDLESIPRGIAPSRLAARRSPDGVQDGYCINLE